MNEDKFNLEIRKFLKKVGITAQREIEKNVRDALASGSISGTETFDVSVTLRMDGVGLNLPIEGKIELGD
jgi:hypothetical protein